ncbi:MAG: dTDP-glucose 4,6-dehydratase [Flavobacteriaceae bacterium]
MSNPTKYSKSILITGGAGFIGSNFIPYILSQDDAVRIINIDKLTYAGDLSNLEEVKNNKRYNFIKGDIADRQLVDEIFDKFDVDGVIHFAAESHVDNSIDNPDNFVETNIKGTYALLESARKYWKPSLESESKFRFHHISTDEVYGSLGKEGYFTEQSPYAPNSPYSATKAASDFLVRSYHHTYGLNTVTSNCSNNYGPKQHDEKLIPTIIRTALKGQQIPIYGKGTNVRDWLYVGDHCRAILEIYKQGKSGETYLVSGNSEHNNLYIANIICNYLDRIRPKPSGRYSAQIKFVEDRPGHDFRYAIDASKIQNELDWKPETSFETGLAKTIDWYLEKYKL